MTALIVIAYLAALAIEAWIIRRQPRIHALRDQLRRQADAVSRQTVDLELTRLALAASEADRHRQTAAIHALVVEVGQWRTEYETAAREIRRLTGEPERLERAS